MTLRCPTCNSTVFLQQEVDRLALACLGCGRHWEQLTRRERAYGPALAALRARTQREPQAVGSTQLR